MTTIAAEMVEDTTRRGAGGRKLTPADQIEELVAAYESSGLSMAAFARREKLCYPTFAAWVKRRKGQMIAPSAPRFAQLRLPVGAMGAAPLSVTLPGGVVLQGSDPAALAALVHALDPRLR